MTQVKICGIKTPDILKATIDAGARFIGFVFYPPSPRYIDIDTAKELALMLPNCIRSVGLFVDPTNEQLDSVTACVPLDMIQLHGSETIQRVSEIKHKYSLPIIKAFSVTCIEDIENIRPYEDIVDWLLFDSKTGGSGQKFDWSLLKNQEFSKPWMLSGGLNSSNMEEALCALKPSVVDVSSGVESKRGVKDAGKIKEFIEKMKKLDI